MHARFMQQNQHFQLNKDYYTHYFLYYTYYFQCLCRIELLVTSTYALQADIQRIYERYHATASRRKLSLLSHWPSLCPFLLYYSHYITIISLLYVLFQKLETGSGCKFIVKKLANRHIKHRGSVSIQTKSFRDSIIKHESVFPHDVRCRSRPIRIGLADVRKRTRTQFRFEPIT